MVARGRAAHPGSSMRTSVDTEGVAEPGNRNWRREMSVRLTRPNLRRPSASAFVVANRGCAARPPATILDGLRRPARLGLRTGGALRDTRLPFGTPSASVALKILAITKSAHPVRKLMAHAYDKF